MNSQVDADKFAAEKGVQDVDLHISMMKDHMKNEHWKAAAVQARAAEQTLAGIRRACLKIGDKL